MNDEELRDQLAKLPHRAIVAFAARCARRVRPLADVLREDFQDAIDRAIAGTESVARGGDAVGAVAAAEDIWAAVAPGRPAVSVAEAAAEAAEAAKAVEVRDTAGAAVHAAAAAKAAVHAAAAAAGAGRGHAWGPDTTEAVWNAEAATRADVVRLIALGLGEPGTPGLPIDPSEAVPLGPLWPGGEPEWLRKEGPRTPEPLEILDLEDVPELVVEIDVPDDATDEDVLALVGELVLQADDLHRSLGGQGLQVERLEVHEDAGMPVEAPRG